MTTQISGTTGISANAVKFMVGQIIQTAGTVVPPGFLKMNGQAVSRATYAELFAVIGTTYGAGDGSTTFNAPEVRGEFLRCLDDGRGIDAGRTAGSAQSHLIQSHNHGNALKVGGYETSGLGPGPYWSGGGVSDLSTDMAGGVETRPRNIAFLALIFSGV